MAFQHQLIFRFFTLEHLENYVNFVDELLLLLLAEVVSSSNIDHVL